MTPYGKIFKILFRKFTWRHQLTLSCSNVVKFVQREIGEIVRYLPDKNKQIFGSISNCRYTMRIAPKRRSMLVNLCYVSRGTGV